MAVQPQRLRIEALLARYPVPLFDAFGVLLDGARALPGAAALIARLNAEGRTYLILSNDASRTGTEAEARYAELGLAIPRERIVLSGELITRYFAQHALAGQTTLVLGTGGSIEHARRGGGVVVDPLSPEAEEASVLVVADERGYPLLETLDRVLSLVLGATERGRRMTLLLANPDLIYPAGPGRFGIAAGSLARMIEAAIELRFPGGETPRFVALGKPHAPIFEEALRRSRAMRSELIMIGDQLETDVRGARGFGIASALVKNGVASAERSGELVPDFVLDSLDSI